MHGYCGNELKDSGCPKIGHSGLQPQEVGDFGTQNCPPALSDVCLVCLSIFLIKIVV
jgi:hypothetical protein